VWAWRPALELVRDVELEVRVRERVADGEPLRGVEREQAADEVEEVAVDVVRRRHDLLRGGVSIARTAARTIVARTAIGLHARTSFLLWRDDFAFGQSRRAASLKYSGFARAPERAKRSGMRPMTTSIIARCSRLSCVW
jgi:hypothetical protein